MKRVFDELEKIKTETCNFCKDSNICKFDSSFNSRYNIYCCYNEKRIVDLSVKPKHYIKCPSWCPKNKNKNIMTYNEKIEALKQIPPFIKWEDIKEKQVYHIPQIPGEERKDIVIIYKSDSYCTYKVLDENLKHISYTIYPQTLISRFLVPHKLQKIEAIKK